MKKILFLLCLFVLFKSTCLSQENKSDLQENVKLYNEKINELIATHIHDGFTIMREEKLPLRSNHDMIITLQLAKGNWYHFSFIGDPSSVRIKAMLSSDEYGDFINDKIILRRENEFWSEFSYQCNQSGNYYVTLYKKGVLSNPLSYFILFKKVADSTAEKGSTKN